MKIETFYFEEASQEHTDKVLTIVRDFLESNKSVEHIIAATTEGTTGLAVAEKFEDKSVIVVTHQTGFVVPNENELSQEKRERIEQEGAKILTSTHAFAGIARGIRVQLGGWQSTEIIAVALRTFGQGTKVCAEIALMAADAGLVPTDRDVVCIAGTGRGADTAWVIQPTYTQTFPKLRMRACLCKPLSF
ncbi:MAG: pyruvate kinase alpha/beta domain-containing protein [Candidatus Thorarchaeota archaeon]